MSKVTGARPDTWMPLYWGDYLRDTGHLSTAEHGAYLLLIGHYWTNGKPLPDDDGKLRRICRMTSREWDASRETLAAFFQVSGGFWKHGRIDDELERASGLTNERSKAGSKGAAKRWQTHGNGKGEPPGSQWQIDGPSPSPSPSQRKKESSAEAAEFVDWYAAYPRHVAKGPALKAYVQARKKADAPTLLAAAKRFAVECQGKDPQYIPHPATWLNGERWADETAATARQAEPEIPGFLDRRNGNGARPQSTETRAEQKAALRLQKIDYGFPLESIYTAEELAAMPPEERAAIDQRIEQRRVGAK